MPNLIWSGTHLRSVDRHCSRAKYKVRTTTRSLRATQRDQLYSWSWRACPRITYTQKGWAKSYKNHKLVRYQIKLTIKTIYSQSLQGCLVDIVYWNYEWKGLEFRIGFKAIEILGQSLFETFWNEFNKKQFKDSLKLVQFSIFELQLEVSKALTMVDLNLFVWLGHCGDIKVVKLPFFGKLKRK